jgi:predicted transposase YdaD
MPHPYDASTKYLLQTRLADWLPLSGRTTTAELQVIDADLATVTAAADRVLRVCEDPPWLLHLELQSSRDPDLLLNLPAHNILLERRHGALVRTVVVLLRKSADWSELTGTFQREFPGEPPYLVFRYGVVRVWQLPAEMFLSGGMGILPLAPLSAVAEAELPGVIRRMDQRIRAEATADEAGTLWTAADVLMGLRYPRQLVAQLLQGVHGMKESVTYQAIVEEGKVEGKAEGKVEARQEVLLQLGRKKFGVLDPSSEMALRGITDPDRLTRLIDALLDVSSWKELLATP